MSFNRFIHETLREHPKLRPVAESLFPAEFVRQWKSVQDRGIEAAILGMMDFQDRCFQSALFRGDLLEDIAATDPVAGSSARVVVTNLTEPDESDGRHLVQLLSNGRLIESIFVSIPNKQQTAVEMLKTVAPLVGVTQRPRPDFGEIETFTEAYMAEALLSHSGPYAFRIAKPVAK